MKRNPDTRLTNSALQELAEYIASRRDWDNAGPKEIEVALKKAGKIPAGDHYYTAFHAGLKAAGLRRALKERALGEGEWDDKGMCDDAYYVHVHRPCGTEVMTLVGHVAICPKCQPEEWAETKRKEGFAK